jgi:hypothetical protein
MLFFKMFKTVGIILGVGVLAVLPAGADTSTIVLTYAGSPGATSTSLADTSMFDFNNLSIGVHTNVVWSGVGSYNRLSVVAANEYGGVAGSPYSVESTSSSLGGVSTTTLTLTTPVSYFGLWWSAGDANNTLSFYSGGNLLATFTTAILLNSLPSNYLGNPNSAFLGQDGSEKFAFINFFGQAGTTFNQIVFSNSNNSGFESDNQTIRVGAFGTDPNDTGSTLPGVPVEEIQNVNGTQTVITNSSLINTQAAPEPGTFALLALAGSALLWRTRRPA